MAHAGLQHHRGGDRQPWARRVFLGVWTVLWVVFGSAFLVRAVAVRSLFAVVLGLVVLAGFTFAGLRLWRSAGVDIPMPSWLRSWTGREGGGGVVTHSGFPHRETPAGAHGGPASTPGPFGERPRRPQTKWFWIGGVLIVGGLAGAAFGLGGLIGGLNSLERVPFRSGGTVNLDGTGGYVVYATGTDVHVPDDMGIVVVGPNGEQVPTEPVGFSLTINVGSEGLTTVATFDAPAPGAYRIAAVDAGSAVVKELAVGRPITDDLVWVLIGGVSLVVGVVVVVSTWRRMRRRRAASEAATEHFVTPSRGATS